MERQQEQFEERTINYRCLADVHRYRKTDRFKKILEEIDYKINLTGAVKK